METLEQYNKLFSPITIYSNWADRVVLKKHTIHGDRYLDTGLSMDAVVAKLRASIVLGIDYLTQSLGKNGVSWKATIKRTEDIL